MSIWFITGASRGFGAEIARAALARGHQVVATARDAGQNRAAFPPPRARCRDQNGPGRP